jgi:hypothetical protein
MDVVQRRWIGAMAGISLALLLSGSAQEPNPAGVIHGVDAAVAARFENVLSFTDVERYAVYRGNDETHPVAEMTVRDNYKKGVGKTYDVLSESGSSIFLHVGLKPLLESEQNINQPGNVEKSWFNSSNYDLKLNSAAVQQRNGRACYALDIAPKEKAPNLIVGTIWVDTRDQTLVEIDGVASKDPSPFSGTTHMMRRYTNIDGFSMATHARAESDSPLFGRTVITIDYSDYKLEIRSLK